MEKNEIKKELYRTKPTAYFQSYQGGLLYYKTLGVEYHFSIPVEDTGTAPFLPEMPAQQLNRWLQLAE
jgi:hypothetical protein